MLLHHLNGKFKLSSPKHLMSKSWREEKQVKDGQKLASHLWVLVLLISSSAKYSVKTMIKMNELCVKLMVKTHMIILCRLEL